MKRSWLAAPLLAVLVLSGCSEDEPEKKDADAAGGYDKDAYCALVEEALEREPADPSGLRGDVTPESAKALEEALTAELAFMEKVAAAAPEDLAEEWQSVTDVQAEVAEQGRRFGDPAFVADFKKKTEDQRAEFLLTEVLGPFSELDEKELTAIADHAESECDVEGLFGS